MSIDKDLQAIYASMVKTTYMPIIRRTIVILLIHDMDRMQALTNTTDMQFMELIRSPDGKKSLFVCLDSICKKRADVIDEILKQYGLHSGAGMVDFYHEQFDKHFIEQAAYVKRLINFSRFDMFDRIARTQPE